MNIKEKVLKDGYVIGNNILKVDSFINHQVDTKLIDELGEYFSKKFTGVTKILTIETSGIAFGVGVARYYNYVPLVFAKKSKSKIVDDFMAEGNASIGLIDLCKQANAEVVGVAIVIEKGFQNGRKRLEELGIRVESAVIVDRFENGVPILR